jgi:hypothetical protein
MGVHSGRPSGRPAPVEAKRQHDRGRTAGAGCRRAPSPGDRIGRGDRLREAAIPMRGGCVILSARGCPRRPATRLVAETVPDWDRRLPMGRWLDLDPIRVLYARGRASGVAVLQGNGQGGTLVPSAAAATQLARRLSKRLSLGHLVVWLADELTAYQPWRLQNFAISVAINRCPFAWGQFKVQKWLRSTESNREPCG